MLSVNGLFNALIYGLNANLRAEIARCCCGAGEPAAEEVEMEQVNEHSVLGEESTSEEANRLRQLSMVSMDEDVNVEDEDDDVPKMTRAHTTGFELKSDDGSDEPGHRRTGSV